MTCNCVHSLINKLTLIGGKRTISDYCLRCRVEFNQQHLSALHRQETTRHNPQIPKQVLVDPQTQNPQGGAFPVD